MNFMQDMEKTRLLSQKISVEQVKHIKEVQRIKMLNWEVNNLSNR